MSDDLISRQAAIDATRKETVSTNSDDFEAHEKFIPFMSDREASSFGKWQWANGFNSALVQTEINLGKLPSAQPMPKRGKWILDRSGAYCCSECMEPCATYVMMKPRDKFCKMCGSRNEVTK